MDYLFLYKRTMENFKQSVLWNVTKIEKEQ